ncbi:starch-binding protein [Limibacter armeniacum]|uniref:starch-binding protein n=1 Tax=Limibacter armeniacum TaxID=466084 RepID=UPI002FE66F24
MFRKQLLFILSCFLGLGVSFGQSSSDGRVLLQGFYWEAHDARPEGWYNYVSSLAPQIADAGIDMIWLPPPSDAGSDEGYLPRQLNNLSNSYGTETEHRAMLQNLNNNGIEPIADIVINHRVGSTNWLDFTNPTWESWTIASNDEVWSQAAYQSLPRGNNDTGTAYEAARDIDHSNTFVQSEIITWLNYLKAAGYKGWRYDFVHGFGAGYISQYNGGAQPTFSVGEDWQSKQEIQNWIDGTNQTSTAFDFPTYYTLKSAIKDNNYSYLAFYNSSTGKNEASGLIGWSPSKSVTFAENHDTPRYDAGNNVLNSGNVGLAYAYLLTHPGTPTIYWEHYFNWGVKAEIDALIKVRKDFGLTNTSTLDIQVSANDKYVGLIDSKVAVKIGYGDWSPSQAGWSDATDWTLQASGNNYAVWGKGDSIDPDPDPDPEPANGFTVHYKGYSNPNIYYWGANPTGSLTNATWPGVSMTTEADGWYKYTFPEGVASINLIFNDGGSQQTDDLSRSSEGWYTDGQWYDQNPDTPEEDTTAPSLSFSPAEGDFTNSVTVTISASDDQTAAPTIYYTTDGSTPDSNSPSALGSATLTLSDTTVVMAYAVDDAGNASTVSQQTYNVTTVPVSGGFTVYFQGYSNPNIYYWGATPTGSLTNATWPGVSMTAETDGWYSFTFPEAVTSANLIFNDGAGQQSDDLSRSSTGWYKDGQWYDSKPEEPAGLTVHFKKPSGWSGAMIHYWNVIPSSIAATTWPGVSMTSEGNDWYKYTITDATASSLLFHDGAGNQTTDLSRSSEGWYENGSWSNSSARLAMSETITEGGLKVWPNPSSGAFALQLNLQATQKVGWSVIDLAGRVILQQEILQIERGLHQWQLDLTREPTGLYIIRYQLDDQVNFIKMIKDR